MNTTVLHTSYKDWNMTVLFSPVIHQNARPREPRALNQCYTRNVHVHVCVCACVLMTSVFGFCVTSLTCTLKNDLRKQGSSQGGGRGGGAVPPPPPLLIAHHPTHFVFFQFTQRKCGLISIVPRVIRAGSPIIEP